jgi:hypothetical protein
MRTRTRHLFRCAALVGITLLLAASAALAQSGGGYDLTWSTIDGGGGASSGGSYDLRGTIGQWDAGAMAGGDYTLEGGFWVGSPAGMGYGLYLPLVVK